MFLPKKGLGMRSYVDDKAWELECLQTLHFSTLKAGNGFQKIEFGALGAELASFVFRVMVIVLNDSVAKLTFFFRISRTR